MMMPGRSGNSPCKDLRWRWLWLWL